VLGVDSEGVNLEGGLEGADLEVEATGVADLEADLA